MLARPLLLIDVETTGLNPAVDCIVQISACVLSRKDLSVEKVFTSLVHPTTPVSDRARAVHGLTDAQLRDAPALKDVLEEFDAFVPQNIILAGHNVSFDVSFLRAAYVSVGKAYDFDYHLLDVWSIAFFVLGAQAIPLETYNLNSLCSLFGIRRDVQHDAKQDVLVSAAILRHLYDAARGSEMQVLGQFSLFAE
jgi:DNA polymerase III epsilon subunit family exonuclease